MAPLLDGVLTNPPCNQCGKETHNSLRCTVQDNQDLCQECFDSLPQAKRDDIGDPEWVCENHDNEKVEFFCKTCLLGFCIKCLGDTHESHDVVGVPEYSAEIRCDLMEQLNQVSFKEEKLTRVREKFEDCREEKDTAYREVCQVIDKVINEGKKEVEKGLEKEVEQINQETEKAIIKLEETILKLREQRDSEIRQLKNEASNNLQQINEMKNDLESMLLQDEQPRNQAMQKVKSDLQDKNMAYQSAKTEIRSLLDSSTKNLVSKGGPFRSLVKPLLASRN